MKFLKLATKTSSRLTTSKWASKSTRVKTVFLLVLTFYLSKSSKHPINELEKILTEVSAVKIDCVAVVILTCNLIQLLRPTNQPCHMSISNLGKIKH